MMASLVEHFENRLIADRDRHTGNNTTFDNMLNVSYAASQQFRDANAARIVMEAGSGRTRAETNDPAQTGANSRVPV
jgi:hypothetical protein